MGLLRAVLWFTKPERHRLAVSVLDPWPAWLSPHIHQDERRSVRNDVAEVLVKTTQRWQRDVVSSAAETKNVEPAMLARVERCVLHHWERFTSSSLPAIDVVVARLESGDLGYSGSQANVIREVIMAQAMELRDEKAAECFEREFMPSVRAIAQRISGPRGLDLVENFGADLVLPRATRPPRIAGFIGRTSLTSWLRIVVVNHCQEAGRRKEPVQMIDEFEPTPITARIEKHDPDSDGCEGLLQPIFADAVSSLESEDRLIIKMLILDEVPQQTLASKLGIHSGNVTRRRQRISQSIWERVNHLGSCSSASGRVNDCLELVLAGGHVELQRTLGDVLVRAMTREDQS